MSAWQAPILFGKRTVPQSRKIIVSGAEEPINQSALTTAFHTPLPSSIDKERTSVSSFWILGREK